MTVPRSMDKSLQQRVLLKGVSDRTQADRYLPH